MSSVAFAWQRKMDSRLCSYSRTRLIDLVQILDLPHLRSYIEGDDGDDNNDDYYYYLKPGNYYYRTVLLSLMMLYNSCTKMVVYKPK